MISYHHIQLSVWREYFSILHLKRAKVVWIGPFRIRYGNKNK